MASIRSSIELIDNISSPLMHITSALNMTVSAFESMDAAANSSFDSSNFDGVREHINAANIELEEMVQNINESENRQQRFNDSMNQGTRSASGLERKLLGVAATYASIQGMERLLNLSDTMTLNESRLSLIVDDGGSVEELQNKIFASAQNSRASYSDTAAAIAKMGMNAGNAFSGNDELIAFMEQVNKQFIIGGASAAEQSSAIMQLTQAMAAGALRGEELNSILDGAPGIARSIEESMGWAEGSIKSYAEQGLVTATVVKNALLSTADATNAAFESMSMTFGNVSNTLKNQALFAFNPLFDRLNQIANSDRFNSMATGITSAFVVASGVAVGALDMITQAGVFLADNWSIIAPLIYGVIAALGIYTSYMLVSNAVQLISTGIQTAHAIAIAVKTGATIADTAATNNLTVAQWALNSALLASPITWIIIGIITIIAVIYMAVAAFNKFAGTSVSATGIIVGVLAVAAAFVGNLFVTLINLIIDLVAVIWNYIATFAEFFANVFNDPIGSIVRLFSGMADSVLGILEGIASAADTLFGSNLADSVSGWRSSLQDMTNELVGEAEIKVPRMDASSMHLDRFEYGEAWDAGYEFGEGVEDTISNFDIADLFGGVKLPDPSDYGYDSVESNIADTAENTGAMKDSVDISQEDLKYMRDAAEQETINRYTTAEINIDFKNENHVNSDMDIDGVVAYMVDKVDEASQHMASQGVHS